MDQSLNLDSVQTSSIGVQTAHAMHRAQATAQEAAKGPAHAHAKVNGGNGWKDSDYNSHTNAVV